MMQHLPSEIIAHLLIADGKANTPGAGPWPITFTGMPTSPDNFLTVYDTTGDSQGRLMEGRVMRRPGIQIRCRSITHQTGFNKLQAISDHFDSILKRTITIAAKSYFINNVTRTGDIIPLGKEEGSTRLLFTLNALLTLRESP